MDRMKNDSRSIGKEKRELGMRSDLVFGRVDRVVGKAVFEPVLFLLCSVFVSALKLG